MKNRRLIWTMMAAWWVMSQATAQGLTESDLAALKAYVDGTGTETVIEVPEPLPSAESTLPIAPVFKAPDTQRSVQGEEARIDVSEKIEAAINEASVEERLRTVVKGNDERHRRLEQSLVEMQARHEKTRRALEVSLQESAK